MTVPYSFAHNAFAAALQSSYDHLADGEESGDSVNVAGRLMLLRRQGKLAFATMRDSSGEIQLFALESVTTDFEESRNSTWGTGWAWAVRWCAPSAVNCRSRWRPG